MIQRKFATPVFLMIAAAAFTANAAELSFDRDWCVDPTTCIVLKGTIEPGDVAKVKQALEGIDNRNGNKLLFTITSRGGNAPAAMAIGRMLRQSNSTVSVLGECSGACVLVLAGGIERTPSSRVGIKRPRAMDIKSPESEEMQRRYPDIEARVREYLKEMGRPGGLFAAMMKVPPGELRILSPEEILAYGLWGPDPIKLDLNDNVMAEFLNLTKEKYISLKPVIQKTCLEAVKKDVEDREYVRCRDRIVREHGGGKATVDQRKPAGFMAGCFKVYNDRRPETMVIVKPVAGGRFELYGVIGSAAPKLQGRLERSSDDILDSASDSLGVFTFVDGVNLVDESGKSSHSGIYVTARKEEEIVSNIFGGLQRIPCPAAAGTP